LYQFAKKKKFILFAFGTFFFTSIWRILSSYYVDYNGPHFTWELKRNIGGSGGSFLFLNIFSFLIIILLINYFFQNTDIKLLIEKKRTSVLNITKIFNINVDHFLLVLVCFITLGIFVELLIKGDIPFFTGTPRWMYQGGFLYTKVYQKIFTLLFWILGYIYYGYKTTNKNKLSFLTFFLLIANFLFLLLVGNKFTTPFYHLLYFTLSYCCLYIVNDTKINKSFKRFILVGLSFFIFMVYAMYKEFIIVRGYELTYLLEFLEQRILIFPSQLNWSAYDRIYIYGQSSPVDAIYNTLINPAFKIANPSVIYLMYLDIGPSIFNYLTSYTDAYPGIILELGGPVLWIIPSILMGMLYVYSIKYLLVNTIQRKFPNALFFFIISQAMIMYHAQGQLIFLASWKFLTKILISLLLINYTIKSNKISEVYFFKN